MELTSFAVNYFDSFFFGTTAFAPPDFWVVAFELAGVEFAGFAVSPDVRVFKVFPSTTGSSLARSSANLAETVSNSLAACS